MINLTPPIIRKSFAVTGFIALSLFSTIPAYALSFNFGWSNEDVNITSNPSATGTLTVVGSLDINRNTGQSFGLSDISLRTGQKVVNKTGTGFHRNNNIT